MEFLGSTEVFGGLDPAVLRDLLVHLEPVHVGAGEVVVAAEDVPDSLYLVGHGRLKFGSEVSATGERGPRQVVGAAALLRSGTAGTWVRAVRDSLLLRLSVPAFEAFAHRHPEALLGLCRELVRLVAAPTVDVRAERTVSTVAIVPAGDRPVPAEFPAGLAAALAGHGPTLPLSAAALDAELGPGSAQLPPQDPRNGGVVSWLHRAEQQHRFVLYEADPADTAWTRRCLRQADRVLLVGQAGADAGSSAAERALAALPGAGPRADLVLLHPSTSPPPSGTGRWLANRRIDLHHHVRAGRAQDLRRLARHLAGRACGLVLSGGGMRGFAHLGVMRALDEAGIEVDVIGGTSIGAIMGGFFAAGLDHPERLRAAVRNMVEPGSMVPATLPLVSYSSARKVSRLLREEPAFTGAIEDFWRPFFCVSASLPQVREVVHERGPVWRAVRSSISLPGIYPPVPAGDDLLVDGGVLNNLPVDVMAGRVHSGPIIAVDLQPDLVDDRIEAFDVSLSGWRVLRSRLDPRAPRPRFPGLVDVLMRSLLLASTREQRARLVHRPVTLHLRPRWTGAGSWTSPPVRPWSSRPTATPSTPSNGPPFPPNPDPPRTSHAHPAVSQNAAEG